MIEEWRTIPGIETHEVSNLGRVRSKDRISKVAAEGIGGHQGICEYERKLKGKVLKLHYIHDNCIQVSINGHDYLVHRLVAKAFLPTPRPDQTDINHKDGNRRNNCVSNLEWCTKSKNELHSYHVLGKQPWNKGKHYVNHVGLATRRRNHIKKCADMLELRKSGMSAKQIAEQYGCCERQVQSNIAKAREHKENSADGEMQ